MKIFGHYYQRAREFHSRYEKFLIPTFLVLGFLFDYVTFANVEIGLSFAFLIGYWIVATLAMLFTALYDAGGIPEKFKYARLVAFLLVQFAFGGLLKGVLVFYWFSAVISISWPFIAVIIFLALFNDVFRSFFSRLQVQLSLYFFITFALGAVMLPFIFNSISPWLFVVAGALSLVAFFIYTYILSLIVAFTHLQKIQLFLAVVVIAIAMNVLYFTNIIPPIPLAIREVGIYHSIKASTGTYVMTGEPQTLLQRLIASPTVHLAKGERAYVYAAIFAPTQLDTTIIHEWQYYDRGQKKWITVEKLAFAILGGRQKGYKGYSWMTNMSSGSWRVYVESERGQVLGKTSFTVENVVQPVKLEEVVR